MGGDQREGGRLSARGGASRKQATGRTPAAAPGQGENGPGGGEGRGGEGGLPADAAAAGAGAEEAALALQHLVELGAGDPALEPEPPPAALRLDRLPRRREGPCVCEGGSGVRRPRGCAARAVGADGKAGGSLLCGCVQSRNHGAMAQLKKRRQNALSDGMFGFVDVKHIDESFA